jgi:uncharacterized phage-associated protein
MLLDFDIKKAIAATAFLIEREGGAENMYTLLKKLYYADRTALVKWGKPITGDDLASMDKGPIVSRIYDFLKEKGVEKDLIQWNDVICREPQFRIVLRKEADQGVLSEREMEVLEESRIKINSIRGSIGDWLHKNCPECENPRGSSAPIDPNRILRLAGKTDEEIQEVEQENEEVRLLNYLLGSH